MYLHGPIDAGVEVQECVRTVGKGVDVHADKTVKEAGSLSNCLQFRGGSLIRLGIPWQQVRVFSSLCSQTWYTIPDEHE